MELGVSGIITIAAVIFLIAWAVAGYIRGFLRALLATFSLLIAIVLSALLMQPTAEFLREKTFVGEKVESSVSKYIDERIESILPSGISSGDETAEEGSSGASQAAGADEKSADASQAAGADEKSAGNETAEEAGADSEDTAAGAEDEGAQALSAPDEAEIIESLALPSFIKSAILENNTLEEYALLKVDTFKDYLTDRVTLLIIKAISFACLALVIFIILRILSHALKLIGKIPVIRGINKFLGALLGLFEGLLILWLICVLIMIFSGTQFGTDCMSVIRESRVLSFIYDNNLPVNVFRSFFGI